MKEGDVFHIKELAKSSLSLKAYGEKHGINYYGIMKYWNRQFRVDFPDSKKTGSKKDSFLFQWKLQIL